MGGIVICGAAGEAADETVAGELVPAWVDLFFTVSIASIFLGA